MAKQKTTKAAATPAVKTFPQTEANRKARLERHLRKHPTDAQAQAAVKAPLPVRQKPKAKNSTRAVAKTVIYVPGEGHKSVAVRIHGTNDRKDTAEVMRKTRGKFGSVKPNIFGCEYSRDNVRALCYGVGIKFTGATERKSAKPAHKRKAK
ncbi:hypothetical protein MT068_001466 [Salmonella enterica]|nr:hypothetical protein [Salmonella enterica]